MPLKKTGAYQSIDIRFSYDINGLLEVDVLLEDGSVKSRVINHSPVTLSAQQIEESRTRLSALKIYPRDMLINRTFKAKLEELWARALGDEREEIGRVITDFDAALQSNDMARVDEVRRRASDYLAIEILKHGCRMRHKRCIRHRRKNTSSAKQHRDFSESITYHQHR